ncbi:MAG: hypothetical protein GAK28_02340 [Luteibacter sp.]|uniref:MASE1 domain-containing protein n=1 Tax=Luteibacter sp. TaxID=1886636 RepID=UPI001383E13D|nr:MASE1 domain-containing protein [Luteibacter sp.]KAF1006666.1 MAG: hypothetical protein GAK28_02340 [Luteibacter sp.]
MNDRPHVRQVNWPEQIAVAAAYAAVWEVARHFSFSHWSLVSGIRLACLLLVPRRYWYAMALGETLPVMTNGLMYIPQFGWWYGLVGSIPVIFPCLPVMAWLRRRASVFLADGSVNMLLFGTAALACALISALFNEVAVAGAIWPTEPGHAPPYASLAQGFLTYLLGAYLGSLTLAPSLVALRLAAQRKDIRNLWQGALSRELGVVVALLGMAVFASGHLQGASLMLCRISVALPVVAIAIRHGWQGAALSATLASIALAMTSATVRDPAMIQAQAIFAAALSATLLVTSRRAATAADVVTGHAR